MNEEPLWESSLGLTLMQHLHHEDLEPREVCPHLEVKPSRARYYHISSNSRTLVILLQVDLASSNEPKIVYEGFYEIKDTSIFAWSSIFGVGHYHWLCNPIHQLPPNSKVDYLIRTIQCILNFLQL